MLCIAAHAYNVGKRNSEYKSVLESLFSKNINLYGTPPKIIVWLGDLNYRIQGIETHSARNLIKKDLHGVNTSTDLSNKSCQLSDQRSTNVY